MTIEEFKRIACAYKAGAARLHAIASAADEASRKAQAELTAFYEAHDSVRLALISLERVGVKL